MIRDIAEVNFPEYATLSEATCLLQDMGEKTITTRLRIDGEICPDFSYDWEIIFKGEKYIMPLRQPQGSKENTSLRSTLDLTFHHWAVWQLKRWYFFTVPPGESGTAVPDKYIASVALNLTDFCNLLGTVLRYYYGDNIRVDLSEEWAAKSDKAPTSISIEHSYVWDVLVKVYDLYGVRWQIEPDGSPDRYVIRIGYETTEIGHVFEYGFEGGLLKVERQVQDENIRNMIIGRGGDKNLPYRYFKQHDEDNASFSPDPDWIPELKDIPFTELHGATFRSYVQGWKARHYPDDEITAPTADKAYAPWAWMRGYTDAKFNPVEYVADSFTTADNGYGVKADSSIANYGELMGGLENNEDIYPTIQGVVIPPYGRIDETVAIEPIVSDEVDKAAEAEAERNSASGCRTTLTAVERNTTKSAVMGGDFNVTQGMLGDLVVSPKVLSVRRTPRRGMSGTHESEKLDPATNARVIAESQITRVYNALTGEEHSTAGIPSGKWRYEVAVEVENLSDAELNIVVGDESPQVIAATPEEKWTDTWDIWVKNLWGTKKGVAADGTVIAGETDAQYAERVWRPILGDRIGGEAKVVFSDGWLSTSEGYEFVIADIPVYDDSQSLLSKDGETYQSHWRITLGKSDADLKSTGLYLPSTRRQASAGDHIFFTGIDMPHMYVTEAEKRLDDWKQDQLRKVKDIKPTWVVGLDKIRKSSGAPVYMALENEGLLVMEDGNLFVMEAEGVARLVDELIPGRTFTLADKRFIGGSQQEKLYLQSVTYTYREPSGTDAALLPDVEVVLSDSYTTTANPVSTLQSDVSAIQRQIGSIANMEQVIRAVCDKIYLRKDGFRDRSQSPTEFASLVSSDDFVSGIAGGRGWGLYKDEHDNRVMEVDRLNVRMDMSVNNFVINQVTGRGGTIIESAARMEITRVEDTPDGFVCYFDQHGGSVAHLFVVDDVAFCERFTADNMELKSYRRRVTAVSEQSVTLSKTEVNGTGIPAEGDTILQYGNYNQASGRTFVKVYDIIGGGYERYISGLTSVDSQGEEYFFAGRAQGTGPRLLIGYKGGRYAEWVDGELTINGRITVDSYLGDDKTVNDILSGAADMEYITAAFKENTIIEDGLILSSLIMLGVTLEGTDGQTTYAGISGIYDKDLKGRSIAAWYGGGMVDSQIEGNETRSDRARSLFRMDGTGYLADGRLWWDVLGNMTFGSGIRIEGMEGTLDGTLASIMNFTGALYSILTPRDKDGNPVPMTQEALKNAVMLDSRLAIYSGGDVGAFGADDSGGSGGESGGGVSYERLDRWADYDASKAGWVLSAALGADLNSRLTAAEMSLSDFVTSDQLAAKGYLTQASLSDYATMSWVDAQGYLKSSDYASTLDGRYYTETEVNSLLDSYVRRSGGSTITGSLSFRRTGSRYGFYIEALDDGSMRVNATTDGQYVKGVFTIDMATRQFSLFRAYIGESVALDSESVIYGSPAISDANRIYLNHDKTVWVRYNASLNAIEASHAIVSHGDVTAFTE